MSRNLLDIQYDIQQRRMLLRAVYVSLAQIAGADVPKGPAKSKSKEME